MKLSSHQKTSPRSRSSKMQYVACQNGYRPLPHWVTQFRMEWPCWYRWDDHSYFANQGIQKLHIHWKCLLNLEFIQTRPATCRPLSTDSEATGRPRRCCLPWRHRRVTWITWPPLWRSFHLPNLLPQNSTFFIATASVVKDAVDTPNCQGLREQWFYLRFYVRRTMPPTAAWGHGCLMETINHGLLVSCPLDMANHLRLSCLPS